MMKILIYLVCLFLLSGFHANLNLCEIPNLFGTESLLFFFFLTLDMAFMVLPGPYPPFWPRPQLSSLLLSIIKPYCSSFGSSNGCVCLLHGALHIPFSSPSISSFLFSGSQPWLHIRIIWGTRRKTLKITMLGPTTKYLNFISLERGW